MTDLTTTTEEVIHNVATKDVKVGDRILHSDGTMWDLCERTVIEIRYCDSDDERCPIVLVTVSDTDNKVHQDYYPITSSQVGGDGFHKVPIIVTEAVQS